MVESNLAGEGFSRVVVSLGVLRSGLGIGACPWSVCPKVGGPSRLSLSGARDGMTGLVTGARVLLRTTEPLGSSRVELLFSGDFSRSEIE
jgi:hypothetical protein